MVAQNGTLSTKQQRAVQAMLTERDTTTAALAAGVGRRTLHRWLAEDLAFTAALRAAEAELIDATVRRLLRLQDRALAAIEDILAESSGASDAVRLRAAQIACDLWLKARGEIDIEQRLQRLEQGAQQKGVRR